MASAEVDGLVKEFLNSIATFQEKLKVRRTALFCLFCTIFLIDLHRDVCRAHSISRDEFSAAHTMKFYRVP